MAAAVLRSRVGWALVAIIAASAVPVALYLGSPLFTNTTVQESFPTGAMSTTSAPASAASSPTDPIAVGSGQFGMIDAVHKGEGTAAVFKLPNGGRVLRLEGFRVTNGPDLFVYLSGHPAPRDSGQLHEGGAFEIARLKGNVGDQNYELPADLDLSAVKSVVIYCKQFSVVFSTAELASNP